MTLSSFHIHCSPSILYYYTLNIHSMIHLIYTLLYTQYALYNRPYQSKQPSITTLPINHNNPYTIMSLLSITNIINHHDLFINNTRSNLLQTHIPIHRLETVNILNKTILLSITHMLKNVFSLFINLFHCLLQNNSSLVINQHLLIHFYHFLFIHIFQRIFPHLFFIDLSSPSH